jgi:hypothetical protein
MNIANGYQRKIFSYNYFVYRERHFRQKSNVVVALIYAGFISQLLHYLLDDNKYEQI